MKPRLGPLLVALGAFLWATDSIFRSKVVGQYSPLFIVFMNHLLCLPAVLPTLWRRRSEVRTLTLTSFGAFTLLGVGSSVVAMVFFTRAFATASNYTVPILIQKIQPLVTIGLARVVLKERLGTWFPILALLALAGSWLLAFELSNPFTGIEANAEPLTFAFGAAAIWGVGTVAGRSVSCSYSFPFVTAARYFIGFIILLLFCLVTGQFAYLEIALGQDIWPFVLMAVGPGYLALWVYYKGMKSTSASVATLCELTFPLGSVAINWIFLNGTLSAVQLLGVLLLLAAITTLSLQQSMQRT